MAPPKTKARSGGLRRRKQAGAGGKTIRDYFATKPSTPSLGYEGSDEDEKSSKPLTPPSPLSLLAPPTPPTPTTKAATHKKTFPTEGSGTAEGSESPMTPPSPKVSDELHMSFLDAEAKAGPSISTTLLSPALSARTPSISPTQDSVSYTKARMTKRRRTEVCPKTPHDKEQTVTVPAKTQMYLDFGQSSFGKRSICPMCNMLYVHGVEEDVMNHKKICESFALGVPFTGGWKAERVVASFSDGGRIVEIRPTDPANHRKKVIDVKRIVDEELGFAQQQRSCKERNDAFSLNGKTAFLYIMQKRVAGFCTAEVIQKAFKLYIVDTEKGKTDDGDDINTNKRNPNFHTSRSTESFPAMMGIHQIWCHRSYRKSGIATRLVDTVRARLIFGLNVPPNRIAFSSPTADGSMFAKNYLDTHTPLVYLCT